MPEMLSLYTYYPAKLNSHFLRSFNERGEFVKQKALIEQMENDVMK